MSEVHIDADLNKVTWDNLVRFAKASNREISDVLTDAIQEYLDKRIKNSEVQKHLNNSMDAHNKLGHMLAIKSQAAKSALDRYNTTFPKLAE